MPTSARTRRRRVSLPQPWAGAASGGALFTAEKCRKRAGGCGPRTPVGAARRASPGEALRQQLLSSKPSRPILSTPSRLRAGQWNRMAATATELFSKAAPTAPEQGQRLHAPVFSRNIWFRRRGAHRASAWLRHQSASVERTREQSSRRGDAFIGPRRVSGLTRRVRRLRKTGYTVAPPASPALCATSPQGEAWAGVFGGGAFAVQASGPMWASAPTRERRQRSGFDKMDKIPLAH